AEHPDRRGPGGGGAAGGAPGRRLGVGPRGRCEGALRERARPLHPAASLVRGQGPSRQDRDDPRRHHRSGRGGLLVPDLGRERLMLKVFRRLEEGVNPELEVGRFLTEKTNFAQIAPLAGTLEYRRPKGEPVSIAILQGYVPNQGDAWQHTLNTLARYFNSPELVGVQP